MVDNQLEGGNAGSTRLGPCAIPNLGHTPVRDCTKLLCNLNHLSSSSSNGDSILHRRRLCPSHQGIWDIRRDSRRNFSSIWQH
jgi:hypothetical protein